jgi:hypothetical protein
MTRRRLLIGTAIAAAVIVLAEVGTRLLAPYLPAPMLYADESTAVKARQLERLRDEDPCAAVVVAGNSMARDDLVPARMRPALPAGTTVYNAALDAASPELLGRWLPDHVLPAADPELVVLGISSFDLNDGARISASAVDSFSTAPLTRSDTFGRLQQPLLRNSALFRHRAELRDPAAVWSSIARAGRGDRAPRPDEAGIPGVLDADGAGLSRRDLRFAPGPGSDTLLRTELLNDYALGGRQTAGLRELLADLDQRDVAVALVVLPVTDDYVDAHPEGGADHDRFLATVEELAAEADVPLLDLHDWARAGDFADTHHLAGPAADRLSDELPDLLAEAGVALPSC